jgi:hypothetical protein
MRWQAFAGWIGMLGALLLTGHSPGQTDSRTQPPLATGGIISSLEAVPVVGQPYSAIQVHGSTQTLADGSTVSHHGHHVVARDAEGRLHVEMRLANGKNGAPDNVLVFLLDPVAHTLTTWMAGGTDHPKIASTWKIPAAQQAVAPHPESPRDTTRAQPIITTEDLGTQSMQGLQVTGKRTTTIVPVGRSGNSAPITKTYEVWTSPDLQLVIKQQWTDPRTGQRTVELEKLSRENPDPAVFRPPAGYEVKPALQRLKELEEKLNASQE